MYPLYEVWGSPGTTPSPSTPTIGPALWYRKENSISVKLEHKSSVKPNSHQTIFPTDFQRHLKIKKTVVVGRFKKKKRLV